MRFKGTAALLIGLIVVAAFVYFTEFYHKEERQQAEQLKKNAIQIDPRDIVEVSLIYPDRTITGVKKGEKQWEITTPVGVQADSEAWEQLTTGISGLGRMETVTENAGDLSEYGLNQPSVKVSAKLKDGKSVGFLFGAENPKKEGLYTKFLDGNEVFLTPPPSAPAFTKSLSDMRNKKLLEFELNDVDGLKIVDRAKELELQKTGDNWQLTKPLDAKADNSEVTSLISLINLGRVASFPEPSIDAKTTGLVPPNITITLHDRKAKTDHVLLIGRTAGANQFYARDGSRDVIFVVDQTIPLKVALPAFSWRDKSIAKANWQKVDKIEIQRGSENLTLLKTGSDWKLPDGTKVSSDKVSETLNALELDKAMAIIDSPKPLSSYGLDKPKLEAVFRESSNEVARLAFGKESTTPAGIYVKESRRDPVMVLSKSTFDKLNIQPNQLADNDAAHPEPPATALPRPAVPPPPVVQAPPVGPPPALPPKK